MPEEQHDRADLTTRYDAFVARNVARAASRDAVPAAPAASSLPLDRLYEMFDAVATGRRNAGGPDFHQIILARLEENRRGAAAAGWTSLDVERGGGSGRIQLVGVAPHASQRSIVPDWTVGVAEASRQASGKSGAERA